MRFEYGSDEEGIAIDAQHKLDMLRFYELQAIVATIAAAASAANNPGGEIKFDQTNKMVTQFKELLFPELVASRDEKAKRVKKIMEGNIGKTLQIKMPNLGSKGLQKRR